MANRSESARIRSLIGPDYEPIDWQLDFKSGYRWSESTWYRDIRYGNIRGADVKVPWELGRLQHLPQLAHAATLAHANGDEAPAERLAREFRDQVLDFIAANPPRFGVQWAMTMDVAIRAANLLLAWDIFRAADVSFDSEFMRVFSRSAFEHGSHIAANLEWSSHLRSNHYLADVVGLLFVAVYLPASSRTDAWLLFATRELLDEVQNQFLPDGGNFEGSTCYHRLSAEMATWGLALVLALPAARLAALFEPSTEVLAQGRGLPGATLGPLPAHVLGDGRRTPIGPDVLDRMARARAFTLDITKPSGRVPQIGDNDSGRLFKLAPVAWPRTADIDWSEIDRPRPCAPRGRHRWAARHR